MNESALQVADGRGFVVETPRERLVITAAHCLPCLPPAHAASDLEERTFAKLIGPLGTEPTIWAECIFVDPIADIAVLSTPDGQALWEEAEAYDQLIDNLTPLSIAALTFAREVHRLEDGRTLLGREKAESDAMLLSLDGQWFRCRVTSRGRALWVAEAAAPLVGGMSGSPIVTSDGSAIGVFCVSSGGVSNHREGGPNPYLAGCLPGWLLRAMEVA